MSSLGKFGPFFCVGVVAGYLACRFVSRIWFGAVLACFFSSVAMAVYLFYFHPTKLEAHFASGNVGSLLSWVATCSVPGLVGYAIQRWYEPWMDKLRKERSENSNNNDKVSVVREKLKALNARRLSRTKSRT